jgi:hypothetical protein
MDLVDFSFHSMDFHLYAFSCADRTFFLGSALENSRLVV